MSGTDGQCAVETAGLLRASARELQELPLEVVTDGLAAFAHPWCEPESSVRCCGTARIAQACGLHPKMVAAIMAHIARQCSRPALTQLLRAELGTVAPPGRFVADPERAVEAAWVAPELSVAVLAATVPTLAFEAIVESLLLRSPLLLRPSSRDLLTTTVLLDQLRDRAPALAPFVAGVHWPRSCQRTSRAVLGQADLVQVWGDDDTVRTLERLVPPSTRFVGHGHRVSCAVIGPHEGGDAPVAGALARSIALDTSLFDQRGCMSPHTVFVHTESRPSLLDLAEHLAAEAFAEIERTLPRGQIDPQTAAEVMQLRGVSEFAGCARTGRTFTVVLHEACAFHPAPPARVLHLVPWSRPEDLEQALAPLRHRLSTVALSAGSDGRRTLLPVLQRLAPGRICAPGRMQRPLLLRHHDGRPRLADRVRWVDLEPGLDPAFRPFTCA